MAIADLDAYRALLANWQQIIPFADVPTNPASSGEFVDGWPCPPNGGTTPSTAVVPSRDGAGPLGQTNGDATALRILQASVGFGNGVNSGYSPSLWICDRLSHQGGLSGTVTTEQTTNLPTAALTRYTSGVGVMCGLSIYSVVGGTARDVTVRYTMGGVGSKTSPAVQISGSPLTSTGTTRFIPIPAEAGGAGFQSVEGVTLSGTTGTAGNFGVTLYRPLAFIAGKDHGDPNRLHDFIFEPGLVGGMQEVLDDACLFVLYCIPDAFIEWCGTVHLGVE